MRVGQPAAPAPPAVVARPATSAQILAARRAARNRSLRLNGMVLAVVVALLVASWLVRETANADLPAARALTTDLETLYRAQRAGDLVIGRQTGEVTAGVEGLSVETDAGPRWVLTGRAGGDCYVLWWDADGLRRVGTLPSDRVCTASSRAISSHPNAYDRMGPAVPEDVPVAAWASVLPEPVVLRTWYLPSLILLGFVGLSALVRITIALLTGDSPRATRR